MKRRTLLRTAGALLPVLALPGCASYYYGDKSGGGGGGLMDLITPSSPCWRWFHSHPASYSF